MKSHTYYDVLGVSRDATLEEITTAKNALAKVYHPDANVHKDIDTTAFMQEILEAYRVLSDPDKRRAYNQEVFGDTTRVFRTFTVGPENNEEEGVSFVTYWNTANRLHEVIGRSIRLMKHEEQKKNLPQRIFRKIGLPLASNGILSAVVLGFLEYWSLIEQPLAFLEDQSLWPLSLYLPEISLSQAGYSFAASVITLIPPAFVFLIGQDYLEKGIAASGLKE